MEHELFSSGVAMQNRNPSKKSVHTTWSNSKRYRPLDKPSPTPDMMSSQNQLVTFPVDNQTCELVRLSAAAGGPRTDEEMPPKGIASVGLLMRSKSPTGHCAIPEKDISHFDLALMESKVGSEFSKNYFNVREHELVCAVSSGFTFQDDEGRFSSSTDMSFYWCNFCTFSTNSKTKLLQHVMVHRFHCNHCLYQSFSRADIIQHAVHTHKDFKEISDNMKYCTLLPDFLRITSVLKTTVQNRKRKFMNGHDDNKLVLGNNRHDDGEQPSSKRGKTGHGRGKRKARKKFSPDFVYFDIGTEKVENGDDVTQEKAEGGDDMKPGKTEDGNDVTPEKAEDGDDVTSQECRSKSSCPVTLEEVREEEALQASLGSSSSTGSVSPNNPLSDSASTRTTHSAFVSKQCDSRQFFSKCDLSSDGTDFHGLSSVQGDSSQTHPPDLMPEAPQGSQQHLAHCSDSSPSSCPSLSPPPKLSNKDVETNKQMHLGWTCTLCKYTCVTEDSLKYHYKLCHGGEKLAEEHVSPLHFRCIDHVDENCELNSADESWTTSLVGQNTPNEPPVLVKQIQVDTCSRKIQAPVPQSHTKDVISLKCCHCPFNTSLIEDLRSHILNDHKGKSLSGLNSDNESNYICAKSGCTFMTSSGLSFLTHTQECVPWPQPPSSSVTLEQSVVECLHATAAKAEFDIMLPSHTASSSGSDSRNSNLVDILQEMDFPADVEVLDISSTYSSISYVPPADNPSAVGITDCRSTNTNSGCSTHSSSDVTVGVSHHGTDFLSDIIVPADSKYQTDGPPVISPFGNSAYQTDTTPDLNSADIYDSGCLTDITQDGNIDENAQDGNIDENAMMSPTFKVVARVEYSSRKHLREATSSDDLLDTSDRLYEQGHVEEIGSPFTTPKNNSAEGKLKIGGHIEYPLCQIPANNTSDCLDSTEFDRQGHVEEMHSTFTLPKIDHVEGGLKPAGTPFSCQSDAAEHATHTRSEEGHYKNRQRGARDTASKRKTKIDWVDSIDRKIECIKCDFHAVALSNLRTHMLCSHDQLVSVPFRSLYHKDLHYKCIFFACPSQECMVYGYNELEIVEHYRHCHSSQPHSYLDPSYEAAPVKLHHRRKTKGSHESKKASRPHVQKVSRPLSQCTIPRAESDKQTPYMCLYCDENIYTNTVAEMKAHYLSNHAGQEITIRDVNAFRDKRVSRLFVCDQPECDFYTDQMDTLGKHADVQHPSQVADQYYQCLACGWMNSDYSAVDNHVSMMHESEGGARVVTMISVSGGEQRAVEERFVPYTTPVQLTVPHTHQL